MLRRDALAGAGEQPLTGRGQNHTAGIARGRAVTPTESSDEPRIAASAVDKAADGERAARVAKNRRRLKLELLLFVCMRFQDLFHSPPGVLFAFPSRYWFTIGQ